MSFIFQPDLIKSLIGCLFHLKNKASRDDEEEAFLKRADAVLASSVTRLVKSDTEDFELVVIIFLELILSSLNDFVLLNIN